MTTLPHTETPDATTADVSQLEGVNYLFGHPIAHSLSPLLHNTVNDALGLSRAQIPLPSRNLDDLLARVRDPKFFGASVTMPHKIAIIPHLDSITPEAGEVGACNTIFVREDKATGKRLLCGTNTDVAGIHLAFYRNVADPKAFEGRPGMVVGGGGAARSAVYAMQKYMSIRTIYLVNRDIDEVRSLMAQLKDQQERQAAQGKSFELIHVATAEQAAALPGPGAVVSCIPDFAPVTEAEKEARSVLEVMLAKPQKGINLEMCYHPKPWTEIADITEKAGWQVILGTEAMIWQGIEQETYWTGLSADELPVAKVKDVIAKALNKSVL